MFEEILERNERLPEVHVALAWILAEREIDAVKAEDHARRAIELAPSSARAYAALAFAQMAQGRAEDALDTAADAKRLAPRDPRVLYVRGAILQALDRKNEARTELRRALEIDPAFERADEAQERLEEL
jgi:Flp pilus assembly protein TadD